MESYINKSQSNSEWSEKVAEVKHEPKNDYKFAQVFLTSYVKIYWSWKRPSIQDVDYYEKIDIEEKHWKKP